MRPHFLPDVLPPDVASVVVLLEAVEQFHRTTADEATFEYSNMIRRDTFGHVSSFALDVL